MIYQIKVLFQKLEFNHVPIGIGNRLQPLYPLRTGELWETAYKGVALGAFGLSSH